MSEGRKAAITDITAITDVSSTDTTVQGTSRLQALEGLLERIVATTHKSSVAVSTHVDDLMGTLGKEAEREDDKASPPNGFYDTVAYAIDQIERHMDRITQALSRLE